MRVPRLPLLAGGAVSLLAGLAAGLARLGWPGPAGLIDLHGPLMVCCFFGTVIGLERAVAINRPAAFLAPLLTGLGGVLLIVGLPGPGALGVAAGSLVFLAVSLVVLVRQPALFTLVLTCGALAWAGGAVAWAAGVAIPSVVPLWALFLVLTIAGERLELSRFLPPWRGRGAAAAVPLALLSAGAVLAALGREPAWTLAGIGLLLLTAWSLASDVARRTIRQAGLTRYVAVCILSGYFWLAVSGALALGLPVGEAGFRYDAALHALFVGFVFAMVFGHAPVVLPAVAGIRLPFRPVFYLPLAVLHLSLALRVGADLAAADSLRALGGLANAAAVVLFVATVVITKLSAPAR
jgi:hypothetical protein